MQDRSVIDKQFVFIVGAPRSGTTWLQSILETHPEVNSLPGAELRVFSEYIPPLLKAWDKEVTENENGMELGLPLLYKEEEFMELIHGIVNDLYTKLNDREPSAQVIVDKHPGYSMHIKDILRVLPEARFIHIIRDGRDAVASMLSANKRVGFGFSGIDGASGYWSKCVSACLEMEKKHPDRFCTMRYEDLVENGTDHAKRIFDFLRVDSSDGLVHQIVATNDRSKRAVSSPDANFENIRKAGGKVWMEELSPYQRFVMCTMINDTLMELGYAEDDKWTGISAVQKMKYKMAEK